MQQTNGAAAAMAGSATAPLLHRLREAIISGRFAPGTSLSEVALAEAYAVSRTPVREALKQLQVEGLVEIRPRVGTFVRQPSRREVVELFEIKEMLEGLASRLMAQRGPVPELDRLEANLTASEDAVATNDAEAYAALVHEFHQLLVDGSDNTRLASHYQTLMNQLAYHRLVMTSLRHPGRLGASLHEHRTVLDRIREKDGFGAELAMRDHVRASEREVMSDSAIASAPATEGND
jgi:DNA-binding GntR family transcriptional regulator